MTLCHLNNTNNNNNQLPTNHLKLIVKARQRRKISAVFVYVPHDTTMSKLIHTQIYLYFPTKPKLILKTSIKKTLKNNENKNRRNAIIKKGFVQNFRTKRCKKKKQYFANSIGLCLRKVLNIL